MWAAAFAKYTRANIRQATMIKIEIPGRETIEIEHVVLDYNGTIALDGRLIAGAAERA